MLRFERVVNTIIKEVISPALFSIFVPIEIYDRTRVNPRMNTLTIVMMLLLSICVNDKRKVSSIVMKEMDIPSSLMVVISLFAVISCLSL
jgi:hypothetical protein